MKRMLQVKLSDAEFAHYQDVVPSPESRAGIAEFPKQIRRAHPWLRKVEARVRETLSEKPILLPFGMKDRLLAWLGRQDMEGQLPAGGADPPRNRRPLHPRG